MSSLLALRGALALSDFRLQKLNATIGARHRGLRVIQAAYVHLVAIRRPLTGPERALVDRLLDYGVAAPPLADTTSLLVTPRVGTISPWATKATEIARACGLDAIARVERATQFSFAGGSAAALAPFVHDRMTESVLADVAAARALVRRMPPAPLARIALAERGKAALEEANRILGLALTPDEIDYLAAVFGAARRDPTDVELTMFAQANSEHCRHKIFNAQWRIDGESRTETLFGMIRTTHAANPQGTIVAYADNAAIMAGGPACRFFAGANGRFAGTQELVHTLMKVETHNHPTAIAPFPGAATGAGGEIRDEGATGRGAKPKAGLAGFSVSNLRIPEAIEPWEIDFGRPDRIASALDIMIEGPIGAAAFNNEFGRPNLAGYFRAFEAADGERVRGYHKPIMLAGGIGNIRAAHTHKLPLPTGALLVQLGGPGMLIGMGGGAASSMATGTNTADLDFDSVQRGNAEMQRRAQEVIDACWALGEENPILAIHDVGAGGLSNALPELANDAGRGARIDLRAVPSDEPGMTPREVWSNEAQERYVLAIAPADLPRFRAICERERAPFAVVGEATEAQRLVVRDPHFDNLPVDMDMAALLGKPPRMLRDVTHGARAGVALDCDRIILAEAIERVLRAPTVASKSFLVTIGDRSVGGLCARDQMVGPWQVPVADCAATLYDFEGCAGEAYAIGERTPLAVLDAPASGRMAIGEALTNLAAAPVRLDTVKLSANWMAAAGVPGEDAALFDTVRAVAIELCPVLGVAIPVGKDSLSMRTLWEAGGRAREVIAPVSLIVSAFAPCPDVRAVWTPQLQRIDEPTELLLLDVSGGGNRLGGSMLAQVYGELGDRVPDLDDPQALVRFMRFAAQLRERGQVLAYHDRSDGGLLATVCEMAFAGRAGVTLNLDLLAFDRLAMDVDGSERRPERMLGRDVQNVLAALFNEELGAVIQVRAADRRAVLAAARAAGVSASLIGSVNAKDEIRLVRNAKPIYSAARSALERVWTSVSWRIQRLRDNPACADAERARLDDAGDPGLHAVLAFDPREDVLAPFAHVRARPRIAILREQGVNGQVEMAAAFDRAGFDAIDVHMSDLAAGRRSLAEFKGFAACGGFSFGDVLGAGEGWAKSILFTARVREEFGAFFARDDTFALGLCNGCQMLANLVELIPGAADWPKFVRNTSEQFEARLVMVEVPPNPSILFAGMHGSRLPIVVSHGEGRAQFGQGGAVRERLESARLVALRFVDNRGVPTERYPANPNGSPAGITGVTTPDGRFTALMPHPERVFRNIQLSWRPPDWDPSGLSPWLRLFRNARRWVG